VVVRVSVSGGKGEGKMVWIMKVGQYAKLDIKGV
jgi:hypothetical protein